jgi:hypothetical protein
MATLKVHQNVTIARPVDVVRAQFGDVTHHQQHAVHRGVRFEVLDDDGRHCRYRQTTALGPLKLRQEFVLTRSPAGPLVNTITEGPLAGGTITFHIEPAGEGHAHVTAVVQADVRGLGVLVAPLMRRRMAKSLQAALVEDKADLESGTYPAPTGVVAGR